MVNYQLSPVDVGYVTTIGGFRAGAWQGTRFWSGPEVNGDNVTNPSDTTTVTVYRTNSYGTSSGTLTINVTNLTAPPVTPIAGVPRVERLSWTLIPWATVPSSRSTTLLRQETVLF